MILFIAGFVAGVLCALAAVVIIAVWVQIKSPMIL